jgi:ABC-type dipeptide/oligopeptide/nickel transport system ATPase subunit
MIRELIITFEYHSGKTVKKLRKLELEKKETTDKERIHELKHEIQILQQDYESKLRPVVLEIAFNIESQMQNMSDDEIFKKYEVIDATSSIIGNCVYNICQKLERQPSHRVILEMMPEKFRTN